MGRGKIGGKERKGEETTNLPVFLQADNLTPYLQQEFLERARPIFYKQITKVVTLMKVSQDMDQFKELFERC